LIAHSRAPKGHSSVNQPLPPAYYAS
jgi:hypothetical protein